MLVLMPLRIKMGGHYFLQYFSSLLVVSGCFFVSFEMRGDWIKQVGIIAKVRFIGQENC